MIDREVSIKGWVRLSNGSPGCSARPPPQPALSMPGTGPLQHHGQRSPALPPGHQPLSGRGRPDVRGSVWGTLEPWSERGALPLERVTASPFMTSCISGSCSAEEHPCCLPHIAQKKGELAGGWVQGGQRTWVGARSVLFLRAPGWSRTSLTSRRHGRNCLIEKWTQAHSSSAARLRAAPGPPPHMGAATAS